MTEIDRRTNQEADQLANLAVAEHRVLEQIRAAISNHEALQVATAMWIARVTLDANEAKPEPFMGAVASGKVAAEARRARGARTKRRQQVRHQRPVELGGHRLKRDGVRWGCVLCRDWSRKWIGIAGKSRGGSVARRWAAKAQAMVRAGVSVGKGHAFLLSGEVFVVLNLWSLR